MNIQKLIAIAGAVAINAAVLFGFHAWSSAKVSSATGVHSRTSAVVTLPTIEVRPSAAQMRALRQAPAAPASAQTNAGGGLACVVMPYYSFAVRCAGAIG